MFFFYQLNKDIIYLFIYLFNDSINSRPDHEPEAFVRHYKFWTSTLGHFLSKAYPACGHL